MVKRKYMYVHLEQFTDRLNMNSIPPQSHHVPRPTRIYVQDRRHHCYETSYPIILKSEVFLDVSFLGKYVILHDRKQSLIGTGVINFTAFLRTAYPSRLCGTLVLFWTYPSPGLYTMPTCT